MGSYITLGVGELELDWGKNYSFRNYSKLFLPSDKKLIKYYYADDFQDLRPGYSRPLNKIRKRLDLLGYSLSDLREHFDNHNEVYPDYLDLPEIDFDTIKSIFSKINISEYKNKLDDGDYDLGEYVIENPNNRDINLEWRTQDVIDGGWASDQEIYVGLEATDKFLIVTEGSSDTYIIRKSLTALHPDLLDFFDFVDMEENYPFTGTGNLYKFCQGLSSIKLQNKTLVIFDNDTEGVDKFKKTSNLDLPKSMKIMKLPELKEFETFLTVGPSGNSYENINGKAVAIECFLDFAEEDPKVRWTNYSKEINSYQGSLERKETFIKKFKKIKNKSDSYNFTKLKVLIDEIIKNCTQQNL